MPTPDDIRAEQAVLGAMLLDPTVIRRVTTIITARDYRDPRHITLHQAITALHDQGTRPDSIVVLQHLEKIGAIKRGYLDGPYLHTLVQSVPTTANAAYYATHVAQQAYRRRLHEAGTRLANAAAIDDEADRARIVEQIRAELGQATPSHDQRAVDGGSFLFDIDELPTALWGRGEDILWAHGESLMICGPQGTGKTTLAGQLLRATLGLGDQEVLGFPVTPNQGRTLYLAMDRPQQTRRALARMFDPDYRDYLEQMLTFWSGPPPADFATHPETLLNLARRYDADLVFIDSIKDAAVGLAKDEVGAGYNRARQLALAEGVQLVELHHMVKNSADGGPPKHLKDIYGSVWLTAGAGSVILLWGEPGDPVIEVHHLKQPMNEVGPMYLSHDRETGQVSEWHDPDSDLVALARSAGAKGIDARTAAKALYGANEPSRAQVEKARRKLARLVDDGLLTFIPAYGAGRSNAGRWVAAAPRTWVGSDEEGWQYK